MNPSLILPRHSILAITARRQNRLPEAAVNQLPGRPMLTPWLGRTNALQNRPEWMRVVQTEAFGRQSDSIYTYSYLPFPFQAYTSVGCKHNLPLSHQPESEGRAAGISSCFWSPAVLLPAFSCEPSLSTEGRALVTNPRASCILGKHLPLSYTPALLLCFSLRQGCSVVQNGHGASLF